MQVTPRFRRPLGHIRAALSLTAALGLAAVPTALAQPPFATPHAVKLAFGASYGNPPRTHSGADLAGEAGESVLAPVAGSVVFVGLVPAGEGARATAVTIQTADGEKLTLLPLEDVRCSRGAQVEAGDELGALAESGDVSSGSTHLHVSLRRGTLYVDPTPLLAVAPPAASPGTPPGAASATQPGPSSALPAGVTAVQIPSASVRPGVRTAQRPSSAQAPLPQAAASPAPSTQPNAPAVVVGSPAVAPSTGAQTAPLAAGASALASRFEAATRGFDAVAAAKRMSALGSRVARQHAKALFLGVGALVAALAAFLNIERTARQLSESARNVGPEGDSVASTQVRC